MEKLMIEGNMVLNLPGDAGHNTSIATCATREQFDQWCQGTGPGSDSMACAYEDQVYVKVPQSLEEHGEFSLQYDCISLDEANTRIEHWNTR